MSSNIDIITSNIKIIRSINFAKRQKLDNLAFLNFCQVLKQIPKDKKIVIILNSLDEVDVYEWANKIISEGYELYGVIHNKHNKWFYVHLNDLNFECEFFINRLQPKNIYSNEQKLKTVEFDYLFLPVTLFNQKKQFADYPSNVIKRFIVNIKNVTKIGYAYSIQCLNSGSIDFKEQNDVDVVITNSYIL